MSRASSLTITSVLMLMVPSVLSGQTRTVQVDGVTLPYVIEGQGPPLVLIHGWAVNRGYWDDDVARLARHYQVIRYDRRGFGGASGKPDPTADAADLKGLLEQLGVTRAHVMGHSQGAGVALTFAVRYPDMVDALILFGPGPVQDQAMSASDDFPDFAAWIASGKTYGVDSLRAAIGRWGLAHFGGSMDGIETRGEALVTAYSGADLLDPAPPSHLAEPAGVNDLAAVTVPTLIIHGDQEMSFVRATADVLAAGIPGARRVIVPGGGHVVNWQQPERFATAVLQFLRDTERTAR